MEQCPHMEAARKAGDPNIFLSTLMKCYVIALANNSSSYLPLEFFCRMSLFDDSQSKETCLIYK